MKASKVHAVIAAGLDTPGLITLWQQDPDSLRASDIDLQSFDLNALQKFAGLTTKIRHNGMRPDFPLTFRLLNVAGLEIELFSAYAKFRGLSGSGYADTTDGRVQDLLQFMEHWLDFDRVEQVLLWDMMRHELALRNLASLKPTSRRTKSSPLAKLPKAADVPRVLGEKILLEMRSDPGVVGAVLQEKAPRLNEVELGTLNFCYWRRSAVPEIHILQLDELGFFLLSLIDGTTSVSALSRIITRENRMSRGIAKALRELAEVGIVDFALGQ